jgi:hypothetical protein
MAKLPCQAPLIQVIVAGITSHRSQLLCHVHDFSYWAVSAQRPHLHGALLANLVVTSAVM